MNYEIKKQLVPFYFGVIDESTRLKVERELLIDSELLVDFLDLKREIEAIEPVPAMPSPRVWAKLQSHFKAKQRYYVPFSLAFAASLALVFVFVFHGLSVLHGLSAPPSAGSATTQAKKGVLFDSLHELPGSSSVL